MNERLYTGPVDQDKVRRVENTWTRWIGPGITLLIALLAFVSGYGALKSQIDKMPTIYVTRVEWLDGFISWWPFRTSTEAKLQELESEIGRLNPDAPRYSRLDADKYQEKRERIVDARFDEVEDQIKELFKRVNACENIPRMGFLDGPAQVSASSD